MRTYTRFLKMLLCFALAFSACDKEKDDNSSLLLMLLGGGNGGTVVNIAAIPGVTPPAYTETPVTTITETDQYTGTVSWSPSVSAFAVTTVYTATITLRAKSGFTLTGVAANFFTVAGSTSVSNSAGSGVVTAVFPATGAVPPIVINIAAIPGVTAPVLGATPVATITETDQYTGTVTWSPSVSAFAVTTVYTATITLTAKSGYTLTGVAANFFTVAGTSTAATNPADSGMVTAVFPATGAVPPTVINIAAIPGVTAPVLGATPVATITETDQYTGTVTWSPSDSTFAAPTVYTATITLTAKSGYTLTGVAANFFMVAGTSTAATNPADSGVVTAVFPAIKAPGDIETCTADSVTFIMAYVPGGKTFPTGTNDLGTPATVDNAYWIGETEVTYELWQKVYTWATDAARGANRYYFANFGYKGDNDSRGIQHPVTMVNWRDSMVWCNALTEWYNAKKGTSYACVYTSDSAYTAPIRDSRDGSYGSTMNPAAGSFDNPYVNPNAKGFRLLASKEYELAARWRNDSTNTVAGYTNPYFTKGNSASGATTYYNDATGAAPNYAGRLANEAVAVCFRYWNGSSWAVNGVTSTAAVKSKGLSGANALGLYDMSGNVAEWCFDLYVESVRVMQGGGWYDFATYLQVAYSSNDYPYDEKGGIGFRFARTQ